ncbi:D-beta-hydroxybutyrate dehydrogenase [Cupriavidus oxalaticus]|uniref:SDR family NAD(P)-dependent oxidoreductase n=1 Tax=Cupriavidus oxalaticus TaxID=96344 RepID=UPI003F733AA8
MSKTWLVTGAARGIGAAVVRAALAAGDRVVATGRDPAGISRAFEAQSERLLPLRLDVSEPHEAQDVVDAALEHFGGIDVLVNNAGYAQLGVFEEMEPAAVSAQFSTNVFGLMNVTRAVLPQMRRQRAGHIFNLSSIAGIRGGQGGTLYSASKFAVEGFSESLALEVAPFGISVTLIEPGYFRTDFLDASSARFATRTIPDYADQSARLRAAFEAQNRKQPGDPEKLGCLVAFLASQDKPPLRFAAGSDAINAISAKAESLSSGLAAWQALSLSTDWRQP